VTAGGRPRSELSDEQRVALIGARERLAAAESAATQAEHELHEVMRAVHATGVSVGVIAEAVGASRSRAHAWIAGAT
jgi:hypothetical protein